MRVVVNVSGRTGQRGGRGEEGAVALMMAACMLLLCVLAAFVVDFGQAYVNKEQAQVAADASALAAGRIYAGETGTCDQLAADTTLQSSILVEVARIRARNLAGSTRVPGDLATCTGGTLIVHYGVAYKSPLGLGSLAVNSDHITVERTASVALGRTEKTVGSMRPWMICGVQIPPGPPFATKVTEIGFPGNGHKPPENGCTTDQSGDWWITRCPDGSGGSKNDTIKNIMLGCPTVTLAPLPSPVPTTPAALGTALGKDCNASPTLDPKGPWLPSTYCVGRDSGGNLKNMADAWKTLLGQTIAMPVFCDIPQCDPSSLPKADSNGKTDPKALWPVWKMAAVTVCGYALHGEYSSDTLPTGDCNNYNPDAAKPSNFGTKDSGFLLIFRGLLESGQLSSFPVDVKTSVRLVE